jgi:alpha-L-fucosidase 2
LLFAGKVAEAQKLASESMVASPPDLPNYETPGTLSLTFPEHVAPENYRRQLDIDTGIASVIYSVQGVKFSREIFAPSVDRVIVLRLRADLLKRPIY